MYNYVREFGKDGFLTDPDQFCHQYYGYVMNNDTWMRNYISHPLAYLVVFNAYLQADKEPNIESFKLHLNNYSYDQFAASLFAWTRDVYVNEKTKEYSVNVIMFQDKNEAPFYFVAKDFEHLRRFRDQDVESFAPAVEVPEYQVLTHQAATNGPTFIYSHNGDHQPYLMQSHKHIVGRYNKPITVADVTIRPMSITPWIVETTSRLRAIVKSMFTSRVYTQAQRFKERDIRTPFYYAIRLLPHVQFDALIYAPPHSGKTFYQEQLDGSTPCQDTDHLPWNIFPAYVITNMPHLIQQAKHSIAILPLESTFGRRCGARGLNYNSSWFDDAFQFCLRASIFVRTDKHVLNAMEELGNWRDLVSKRTKLRCSHY